MGRLFYDAGDILIRERHIRDYLSPGGFCYGETFKCDTGVQSQWLCAV